VETKNQPPPQRPSMVFTGDAPSNRPDLNASRGTMFREQGIELNSGYDNVNRMQQMEQQERSSRPTSQSARPEMRGPQSSDIDNILSGLKTRSVNIQEQQINQSAVSQDDDSMISISSLKDIQNANMPKRTNRRRNRSDKNTISLDI